MSHKNTKSQSTFSHYIPDPKDCPCPPSRVLKTRVGTPPTPTRPREAEDKALLYPTLRPRTNYEAYRDYYCELCNLYQQYVEKKRNLRKKRKEKHKFKLSSDVTLGYLQNCSQSCAQRFIKTICAKPQKPQKLHKESPPKRVPPPCTCAEAQTSVSCLYVEPSYKKDSDSSNLSSSVDDITCDPSNSRTCTCTSHSCTKSTSRSCTKSATRSSSISASRTCTGSASSSIKVIRKGSKSSNKLSQSVVSLGRRISLKSSRAKRRTCSVCPEEVMCTFDAGTQAAVKQDSYILQANPSCAEATVEAKEESTRSISGARYVYWQNLWVPCFAICLNVLFFYYFFETFPGC